MIIKISQSLRSFEMTRLILKSSTSRKKLWSQDKGQKRMVQSFIEAILQGAHLQ